MKTRKLRLQIQRRRLPCAAALGLEDVCRSSVAGGCFFVTLLHELILAPEKLQARGQTAD